MEQTSPFSFHDEDTEFRFATHSPIGLFKLKPDTRLIATFGRSDKSRLVVGIHWDKHSGKSRMCAGSQSCGDCDLGYLLQFHLYAGICVHGSPDFKTIVDLGTTMAKRWKLKPPDFSVPHVIWRKDKYGSVFCDARPYDKTLKHVWDGWDIREDVERIFRGRKSPPSMSS